MSNDRFEANVKAAYGRGFTDGIIATAGVGAIAVGLLLLAVLR